MLKPVCIAASLCFLFANTTGASAQTQNDTGQPPQPSSSIYNRMRRMPPQRPDQAQPTTQSRQFPNAGRQFPPETQGSAPGQRPPMRFPHAAQPEQAQPAANPQQTAPTSVSSGSAPASQPQTQPAATAPQGPTGLALKPANPPRISFAAGELTVTADNSLMGDVLRGISRATGARLEGSQSDPERVFGQFGPDTPRAVLNSLLSGSRYDFILVGAIDDPGVVQRILLSPRGVTPSTTAAAGNQAPRSGFSTPQPEEEDSNESFVAPQPQVVEQPAQAQAPQPGDQAQSQQQFGQPQQTVKTPEQLLQELQRLRQQQQQQQTNNPR